MSYEYALLCMHGMGDLDKDGFKKDIAKVKQALAERIPANDLSRIYIPAQGIFYSDITQPEEERIWNAMASEGGLDTGLIREITINKLRRFVIYGFSDATAFAGVDSTAEFANNTVPYTAAQERILDALKDIYERCGPAVKVVLLSHSLGCQVMSSYLWDAQLHSLGRNVGSRSIWSNYQTRNKGLDDFLHLKLLKT